MSTFTVTIEIAQPQSDRYQPVEVLVDTGATYTKVPRAALAALGITPAVRRQARSGDGRTITRELGEARIRFQGEQYVNLVTFGEAGEDALLGSITLETFSLAVDPVNRRLVPVTALELDEHSPG